MARSSSPSTPGSRSTERPGSGDAEDTTAQRIVDAGGQARASNISVTDEDAVRGLFAELVEEFGALDAVVNVAGISRPTGFASGVEDDWRAVLDVHLNGYLNVLRAALPLMAAAGHGRILGVTSGSGWRPADAGAYSCAKRAVAALTWQIGQVAPSGVTVNALSPIAATRMVLGALSRQAGGGNRTGRDSATGGVSLSLDDVPPPEHLGPIGAYLAGEDFAAGCRGQVMFSNGAEVAWVVPPQLLEVARTTDVGSLPAGAGDARPHRARAGRGNPSQQRRREPPSPHGVRRAGSERELRGGRERAVVVTDVRSVGHRDHEGAHVPRRRVRRPSRNPRRGSRRPRSSSRPWPASPGRSMRWSWRSSVRARERSMSPDVPAWQRVLDEHTGITDRIATDAAWVRAVADLASGKRPAGPGRHRRRRDDGRGTQSGPSGQRSSRRRRAPGDGRPGGRLRDQRGVRAARRRSARPPSSRPTW